MSYSIQFSGRAMKTNSHHSERKLARALRQRNPWWATPAAFLATLLALPVNAAVTVQIPADPLASGVRVAPNILFILDDSGSMARTYMPDSVSSTSTPNVSLYAYPRNSLSYNPAITYSPWMNADGTRLTGGTNYTDAYSSTRYVPYTGVKDDGSTGVITTSGTTDLSADQQVFYVPQDTTRTDDAYLKVGTNYRIYVIPQAATDILSSSIYGNLTLTTGSPSISPNSGTLNSSLVVDNTTAGVSVGQALRFNINNTTSNSSRKLNYWIYDPAGTQICSGVISGSNASQCTLLAATAGGYKVSVQRTTNNSTTYSLSVDRSNSCNLDFSGSGKDFINCAAALPNASRTVAQELVNYSTWYSYFHTRNKVAKAGAAEAFSDPSLGNKVRVGFTTIWGENPFYIPVGDLNDGRFTNNDGTNGNPATKSRSKWYSHLFAADASGNTPLQKALTAAGEYYSNKSFNDASGNTVTKTGVNGPYGPESSALSCRQNFTILTTDGYWNDSTVDVGDADSTSDTTEITNGLPAADPNYKHYKYTAKKPYSDSRKKTLADIAMYYWKRDLRTDLDNNVPSSYPSDTVNDDPAFWQHMVTFGISIGLSGTSGWKSISDVPANATWTDPTDAEDGDRIDDLLHAAVNGRGTFVAATNPQLFADGLAAALAKINERAASFSNAGASDSTQLNSGTLIFTASYISGRWTGLLRAEAAVSGAEVWRTSNAGLIPAYGSRKIFTRGGILTGGVGAGGTGGGTTFPTANQSGALARTGGPANYEVTAADNADYIKGNQAKEGSSSGQLRVRSTVMGDVVNSSPAYVPDSDTVFIGANDGMLHAVNGSTGAEKFAYIPGIINFGNLADLSRGDYEHRWFVDGPIAISPKALSPDGTKNILVGTLGRGGKGLYSLDVTNPGSFGAGDVKWERNSTSATPGDSSDNMGMVLGAPVLAKVRNGASTTSAVVLGNGINSGSDKAALIVLNMDDGSVIKEIATDATTGNGLFAPTAIYAADGQTIVYAYAGDLQGNIWKFDLTSTNSGSWSAKKIFHAEKTAGKPQPITGGIASAIDPRTNTRWVFFGTGSYLTAADGNDSSTSTQSMYGVMDDGGTGYDRTSLFARTVTDGTGADAGERTFQPLTSTLMGTKKGWYVDLPDKGERIVQGAQMDGSFLVTASMMPSGNSCADASGSGYINGVTPFPDMAANGKSYFDLNNDGNSDDAGTNGKPTGSMKTNGMPTLPLLLPGQLRYQTSSGSGNRLNKGQPQWNRVSWRELRND